MLVVPPSKVVGSQYLEAVTTGRNSLYNHTTISTTRVRAELLKRLKSLLELLKYENAAKDMAKCRSNSLNVTSQP